MDKSNNIIELAKNLDKYNNIIELAKNLDREYAAAKRMTLEDCTQKLFSINESAAKLQQAILETDPVKGSVTEGVLNYAYFYSFTSTTPQKVEDIMQPLPPEEGDRLPHYKVVPPAGLLFKKWLGIYTKTHNQGIDINEGNDSIFLSEFLSDLGDNCIFEKEVTGCGGTTLALNQTGKNVIIAMPTRNTVDSKRVIRNKMNEIERERDDVFCIYGGYNDNVTDVNNYLYPKSNTIRKFRKGNAKIVCTYDKLGWLYDILTGGDGYGNASERSPRINPSEWWLYIDEMHEIINIYNGDRRENIHRMLDCIDKFKHVVFITATPLKEEFFFKEIFKKPKRFKVVKVVFPDWLKDMYHIDSVLPNSVVNEAAKRLSPYLRSELNLFCIQNENAHVFVNSVSIIISIMRKLNFIENCDKFNIVCSTTNEGNELKLLNFIKKEVVKWKKEYGEKAVPPHNELLSAWIEGRKSPISSINEKPKKINFYTATAFCGADIYDSHAKMYVISDYQKKGTLFDISTTFRQIAGRIRDCQNKNICYIFNKNPYKVSKEDFEHSISQRKKTRDFFLEDPDIDFNEQKKLTNIELLYIVERNGGYCYDYLLEFKDRLNFNVFHDYTLPAMKRNFADNGMQLDMVDEVSSPSDNDIEEAKKVAEEKRQRPTKRENFKEKVCNYFNLRELRKRGNLDVVSSISFYETTNPKLADIYDLFTLKEVQDLNFKESVIVAQFKKRKLEKYSIEIRKELASKKVFIGAEITAQEKKTAEKAVQEKFNIDTFKVQNVYNINSDVKRINNKPTRFYKVKGYKVKG